MLRLHRHIKTKPISANFEPRRQHNRLPIQPKNKRIASQEREQRRKIRKQIANRVKEAARKPTKRTRHLQYRERAEIRNDLKVAVIEQIRLDAERDKKKNGGCA